MVAVMPDLICLADVEARPVEWLWEPFIPMRMLSMISGDPGAGKSFVALSVAADLSRGKLRDGRIVEPADTLYMTVENPTAEVMRPRFDSLDGDPQRLYLLQGTCVPTDGGAARSSLADRHCHSGSGNCPDQRASRDRGPFAKLLGRKRRPAPLQ